MSITPPIHDEKDIEAQTYVSPVGHQHNYASTGGILEANDGVPRGKGFFAPLWKAMAWFDRVNGPYFSDHAYISNMNNSSELK